MKTILAAMQWALVIGAIVLSTYCVAQFRISWKRIAEIHGAIVTQKK